MLRDKGKLKRIQKITAFTLFGCVMVWLLLLALDYWKDGKIVLTDVTEGVFLIAVVIALIDAAAVFIMELVINIQESCMKQAAQKWVKDFLFGLVAGGIVVLLFDDNRETLFHIGMLWSILTYGFMIWFGSCLGKFWSRKFPENE